MTREKPTYKQKIQVIAGNKVALKKAAEEAKDKIRSLTKDKLLKGQGPPAELLSAATNEMFILPITTAQEKTKKEFKSLGDEYAGNLGELNKNLAAEITSFKEYAKQMEDATKGYLNKLTEGSPKGKITKEILTEMKESKGAKAALFTKILLRNDDLTNALQGALGTLHPGAKEKSFQNLEKYLDKYPKTKNETTELAFVVLALMGAKDRKEFTKNYLKKRNQKDQIEFLEYGNLMGAYTPKDMAKFHPQGKNISLKKKKQYAEAYKAQHDFYKKSKKLLTSSYGGKNAAGEMFTLKNILGLVVQVAAVGTIGANLVTSTFKDGSIQSPSKIVGNILKNEYILIASGALGVMYVARQPETLGDMLMGSAERTTLEKKEAKSIFDETRSSNMGLMTFLEGGGSDFRGAEAFGDYVFSLGTDFDAKKVSIAGFLKWMNAKSKKSDTKKAEYKDLIAKISKKDEKYEFSGSKTENYEIQKLAKAFFILKIGEIGAKRTYLSATNQTEITQAKVKKPSPKTKRTHSKTTKKTT